MPTESATAAAATVRAPLRAGAARRAGGILTFVLLWGGDARGVAQAGRADAREIGTRIIGRGPTLCMNGTFCFRELLGPGARGGVAGRRAGRRR
ncbi:hypothetical protein DZF97_18400, partial [Clavibacter nebraskensis]